MLSPTLFNIFLEDIMMYMYAPEDHNRIINIGDSNITNLRFADDIDDLAGEKEELATLVKNLDEASTKFGMEISGEKANIMTNNNTIERKRYITWP